MYTALATSVDDWWLLTLSLHGQQAPRDKARKRGITKKEGQRKLYVVDSSVGASVKCPSNAAAAVQT
jgi:hypothetical protein